MAAYRDNDAPDLYGERGAMGGDFAATLRLVLSSVAALALATVALYAWIGWQEQQRSLTKQVVQQSRYLSGLSEDFLSGVAYGIDAIARTAGQAQSIGHAEAMWETLRASHPEIDSMVLSDAAGKIAFDSKKEDRSARLLQDLFELESRGGARFYLGVPRYDANYDNPEVGISHVSHDLAGQPVWRVEAKIKLEQLTRRWQIELLPPGARVLLLHNNGYVIAEGGSHSPALEERFPEILREVQEAQGVEGTLSVGEPGLVLAFQRLQKQHASLVVILPEQAIWNAWLSNNKVVFIAFVLSLMVYGFLTHLLLRRERVHSRRLLEQADTDALTGIPNRAAAERHLASEVVRARREGKELGVVYLDLDEFKAINDTYGHQSGDRLLVLLTARLKLILRAGDMLARLGGDEYLAVVSCRSGEELMAVCQRLQDSVIEPICIGERCHRITLSIGAAYFPHDGVSAEELLKKADIAMYAAKAAGRNAFRLFNASMAEDAQAKSRMKAELELALLRREFELWYQPRFDAARHMIGVETLVRWRHPEQGLLLPQYFIPYAEESGLIVPIGRMILKQACQQALLWQTQFSQPLLVSVNISVKELEARDFAAEALQIVAESGVDPRLIQIEVTETMLSSNPDAMLACLQQLSAAGIIIELDDFGTGYSSLSYLRRFPISTIKIDKSFVQDIGTPECRSLVVAIIAMSRALDCTVVAEGVEDEQQLHFLESVGCGQFQGFFLARPELAADIEARRRGVKVAA
jgi:diguanylate cyclase (GGDEF)-like protein